MSGIGDRILNVSVIVLALVVVGRPGGPVVRTVKEWNENRIASNRIRRSWSELDHPMSRVGDPDRVADLVEFIDYQCPFCLRSEESVHEVRREDGSLSVSVRHLPLPFHKHAEKAALAAICAEKEGRFSEMHAALVSADGWNDGSDPDWSGIAEKAGIGDAQGFIACMESDEASERLAVDQRIAAELGIRVTPTFLGGRGKIHRGGVTVENLRDLLAGARE